MEEKLERQKGVGYTSTEDPVWIDRRDLAHPLDSVLLGDLLMVGLSFWW